MKKTKLNIVIGQSENPDQAWGDTFRFETQTQTRAALREQGLPPQYEDVEFCLIRKEIDDYLKGERCVFYCGNKCVVLHGNQMLLYYNNDCASAGKRIPAHLASWTVNTRRLCEVALLLADRFRKENKHGWIEQIRHKTSIESFHRFLWDEASRFNLTFTQIIRLACSRYDNDVEYCSQKFVDSLKTFLYLKRDKIMLMRRDLSMLLSDGGKVYGYGRREFFFKEWCGMHGGLIGHDDQASIHT